MLFIGPIADVIARRSVHPAYLLGVAVVVLAQATTDILAPSSIATALLHGVGAR